MKARVLHLITRLDLGGAQQNTLYSAAHHDRTRFDVSLIAGRGGVLDAEAEALPDVRVELVDWLKHAVAPVYDPVAVVRLAAILRRRRFDVVHTHSSKAGMVGRWAARLAGVPNVVHTVHGWSFNGEQSSATRALYRGLERLTAAITDRLVVVSDADRRRGLELGIGREERYRLIRSGIDGARFRAPSVSRELVRRELGFDAHDIVVGTLACLKPQKAPLDFVEIARLALRSDPRLRFFVAGDGVLREAVERRIAAAGLQGHVKLLGWRRDAVDLLHAMDLFLLTSRFEGLPRAVLQAMAAGVPVVATAVDGTPEVVIDGETGVLVPPGQPARAADRLVALSGDPGTRARMRDAARARLGDEFEIAAMVRALDRLYLELLSARPAAWRIGADADGRT
jgi:glycosyltransferase involved in cell wall biosynthesis